VTQVNNQGKQLQDQIRKRNRKLIKLCPPRAAYTCTRPLFRYCNLGINPITLKLESDLDILNMYIDTENEVAKLRHSKLLTVDEICMINKKYLNSS